MARVRRSPDSPTDMSVEIARKERAYLRQCGGGENLAARTDDELFEAEITHCVCRGSLGLGLGSEGEVSVASTSQSE